MRKPEGRGLRNTCVRVCDWDSRLKSRLRLQRVPPVAPTRVRGGVAPVPCEGKRERERKSLSLRERERETYPCSFLFVSRIPHVEQKGRMYSQAHEGITLAESPNPAWTGRCAFACRVRGPTNPKPQAW